MSSINLLPSNSIPKKKESIRKIKSASFVSFCLIIFSIASLAFLYFDNQKKVEEVVSLESQSSAIDIEIDKEIAKNKLFSVGSEEDKIAFLLSKHPYLTKAIYFIQDNLMDEAYVDDLKITFGKEKSVDIEISGIAQNYSNLATQLYVFKNLPAARGFTLKNISENNLGDIDFEGTMSLDTKAVLYDSGDNDIKQE